MLELARRGAASGFDERGKILNTDNQNSGRRPAHGDFRYYMHDGTTAFSFELSGRLSGDGARELGEAWQCASSVIGDRALIVDLSFVTGISVAGRELLRGWHDRGAQLVAKSAEAKALAQSISGQSVSALATPARHRTWLPFQRVARWASPS